MNVKKLKTVEIDLENKIFKVNGEDFGRHTSEFTLRVTPTSVILDISTVVRYDIHGNMAEFNKASDSVKKKKAKK